MAGGGIEAAVGYVFAWLVREAERVSAGVSGGPDAALGRLHELVARALGADPSLARAAQEAGAGLARPTERTRRRLVDSLEDAAEHDPAFAHALAALIEQLRADDPAAAGDAAVMPGRAPDVAGSVAITARDGAVAAWTTNGTIGSAPALSAGVDAVPAGPTGPSAGVGQPTGSGQRTVLVINAVGYGGVAAGSIGQLDLHQHRHEYAAPRGPAAWPHQVGIIPPKARWFQARTEIEHLNQLLAVDGTIVAAPDLAPSEMPAGGVLAGMGGVGKTQLAAHYARTTWQRGELDLLVWITATDRTTVVAAYARACAEVLGTAPDDSEVAALGFLAWLEPKRGQQVCRWLVVLDDVANPGDLRGLWPPVSAHGRTVVTTRGRHTALTEGGRIRLEVGLFTPEQALAYLTNSLADRARHEPEDELAALAEDLGRLPLALSQAAAYILDIRTSITAYRELLADRTQALADAAPDTLPDSQTHTVAAAWTLSIDHADTQRPTGLARPLLHLLSHLDPNAIPTTILTSPPILAHLTVRLAESSAVADGGAGTRGGASPKVTARQVELALATLHRLSLIDHDPDGDPHPVVRVHQLIQRSVCDTLTPQQHHQAACTAADGLLAVWPRIERNTALVAALRANATALTRGAEDVLHHPDAHTVLYRVGSSLGEAGQVAAARDHFQRLTGTTTRFLGPDHPHTLTARHEFARWWGKAGDAAGAAAALTELLSHRIRVLGPEHPDTFTTRHELADWRGQAGDAVGAATAFIELAADRTRVLGPDHPDTLTTRNQIARWRGEAGDAAGAATALVAILDDLVRVLGPDDPNTLATRHELARWRGNAGDSAGAATALTELLDDMVRVLGPDHPSTLGTRLNIAVVRRLVGDSAGAATALTELLDDMVRVLGPDHPHTLRARHTRAYWRGQGDAANAVPAFIDLVNDMVRVLGPDHPHTLHARRDLANKRGEAGSAADAALAFAELLDDQIRILGPDHPRTLSTQHNFAHWRGEAGNATGAASTFAELLNAQIRILGPDHPDTLTTQSNLTYWRRRRQERGFWR
ncbi:tetratricopeptide repeat protein [Kitasatospora viridis]|uniref:Tetratricopeptide repeat protein n=1 Tax=Kitasatospora viridis TaxID=281105 RepID=A0A561SEV6_9ACTN|nr:tetratricopeptide repeat protein [Kitasatospora viridis]TWF73390.1 tetratricopeptide repeat protein [Kitasatospora viridis]